MNSNRLGVHTNQNQMPHSICSNGTDFLASYTTTHAFIRFKFKHPIVYRFVPH